MKILQEMIQLFFARGKRVTRLRARDAFAKHSLKNARSHERCSPDLRDIFRKLRYIEEAYESKFGGYTLTRMYIKKTEEGIKFDKLPR